MDIEANVEVNYVGFIRRTVAVILDQIIFFLSLFILILSAALSYAYFFDETKEFVYLRYGVFALALFIVIVLEILMVTKLGGTLGKLLCGIYIKDANTLKNVTVMQATVRYILRSHIWIICDFLVDILPDYVAIFVVIFTAILILALFLLAVFDKRKQTFYDKIAKTVVIVYKPN